MLSAHPIFHVLSLQPSEGGMRTRQSGSYGMARRSTTPPSTQTSATELKPTRRMSHSGSLIDLASPRLSGIRLYCWVIYSVGNGERQLMRRRRNRFANCARQIAFGRDVKNV